MDITSSWNEAFYREIQKDPLEASLKKLLDSISWDEVVQLIYYEELVDLVFEDVLGSEYPFKILLDEDVFQELDFYSIRANETIAEVGAGSGAFSLLLALTKNNHLYVNDINGFAIQYLKWKFNKLKSQFENLSLEVIEGNKKSTEFPARSLDKIITRNSFHHFRKKKAMLKSIHESLKMNGVFYIMEYVESEEETCVFRMIEQEIHALVVNNGFVLDDKLSFADVFVLKYRKNPM
jgi:SAM-dependent methyltransferase